MVKKRTEKKENNTRFDLKKTLIMNIGRLLKIATSIILFIIGLNVISAHNDKVTVLFLTLMWCFFFLQLFRPNFRIFFKDSEGFTREEYF